MLEKSNDEIKKHNVANNVFPLPVPPYSGRRTGLSQKCISPAP